MKETINQRFRQTRLKAGLTQVEFAAKLQINETHVKGIEINRFQPGIEVIRRWRHHFKVSYDWIIDGER